MSVKDGGPAFPQALNVEEEFVGCGGMSLRDYFAAHAIIGIVNQLLVTTRTESIDARVMATHAYIVADAMLAARESDDNP